MGQLLPLEVKCSGNKLKVRARLEPRIKQRSAHARARRQRLHQLSHEPWGLYLPHATDTRYILQEKTTIRVFLETLKIEIFNFQHQERFIEVFLCVLLGIYLCIVRLNIIFLVVKM